MSNSTNPVNLTPDASVAALAAEMAEYDRVTVVTEEGETVAQLREAFDAVADSEHWKNPWEARVPAHRVGITKRAVCFFHGEFPHVVAEEVSAFGEPFAIMRGYGYAC